MHPPVRLPVRVARRALAGRPLTTLVAASHNITCPVPASSARAQLGAQDVEAFIKNLVEKGQPVVKTEGLGRGSLSSGTQKLLGAPEGVDANNFDGQRQFDASAFGM
jgi:hypothetical protein